jgi:hypothetical protein
MLQAGIHCFWESAGFGFCETVKTMLTDDFEDGTFINFLISVLHWSEMLYIYVYTCLRVFKSSNCRLAQRFDIASLAILTKTDYFEVK